MSSLPVNQAASARATPFAYRTVVTVEVLSNEPLATSSLQQIADEIANGDASGRILDEVETEVDEVMAAELLRRQGSDPEFLGCSGEVVDPSEDSPWSFANEAPDYGAEASILLSTGGEVRWNLEGDDIDYVRVISSAGAEVGYWVMDEIGEDPTLVMGAILGAMKGACLDAQHERPKG